MSADRITAEFTITFNLGDVSLGNISEVLRCASKNHATIQGDTSGAIARELTERYNLDIRAIENSSVDPTASGLGPYKDTLHEVLSKSLFAAKSCASDPNIEVTAGALANADAAMRLILLMDNAE